jgi:uncharacterized membrane protein
MKINWKSKLTSRKFWAAIVGFVSSVMAAFGATDNAVAQTAGVIMAGATVIAYIIGEGLVDANRNDSETIVFENATAETLNELTNGRGE